MPLAHSHSRSRIIDATGTARRSASVHPCLPYGLRARVAALGVLFVVALGTLLPGCTPGDNTTQAPVRTGDGPPTPPPAASLPEPWPDPWADASPGEFAEYRTPNGLVRWTYEPEGEPPRLVPRVKVEFLEADAVFGPREPEFFTPRRMDAGVERLWWQTPRPAAGAPTTMIALADGTEIAATEIRIYPGGQTDASGHLPVGATPVVTYWVSLAVPVDGVVKELRPDGVRRELTRVGHK